MRLAASEYQNLDLWAHSFLRDVPLHDAFAIDLPGGGKGRTISDMRALLSTDAALKANPLVAGLFKFRFFLGRILGRDANSNQLDRHSYLHRLVAGDWARSLVTPGTPDGPFRLLHMLPRESVSEVQNATVACLPVPGPSGIGLRVSLLLGGLCQTGVTVYSALHGNH